MPISTQLDKFFQTNNYQDFINWSTDIRNSLLALNLYNPQSSFGTTNPKPLQQFLDSLTQIFTTTQLQGITAEAISDIITAENQTETANISTAVQLYSTDQLAAQDDKISTEQATEAANILTDNQTRQDQITREIKSIKKSDWDINNPVPKENRMNSNPYDSGYTRSYQTTDANGAVTVKAPTFPQVNQEYNNHMQEITDRLVNLDTFEVFTGYKSKSNANTDPDYDFKSWAIIKGKNKKDWLPDPQRTFTPDRPFSNYINDIIKKTSTTSYPGSFKFFIEKLHGRYSDGTPYKMNGLKSQKEVSGDGLLNLTNRMVFYAYIENYADNYSSSWNDYNFIGRSEAVPAYKSTKRDITLEFTLLTDYNVELMVAMEKLNNIVGQNNSEQTQDEILQNLIKGNVDWGLGILNPPSQATDGTLVGNVPGLYSDTPEGLWSKLTFLSQCMYPFYRDDGKMKEQPIVRMRIADFYDVIVYLSSLSMQMNGFDAPMVDMNPSSIGNMPFGVRVSLSGTILHNYEPSSTFFGFYNRREFDTGEKDPVTGVGINLQKNKIQLGTTKNSPVDFKNIINNDKLLDTTKIDLSTTALQQNLSTFTNSFTALQNAGIRLKDNYIKQKTQESIIAFKAVSEITNYLRILYGANTVPISTPTDLDTHNVSPATKPNVDTSVDTTTVGKFNSVNQDNQLFKDAFDSITSNSGTDQLSNPGITNVDTTVTNDLNKISGNIMSQSDNQKLTDSVKAQLQNYQPKTLQDIIDYSRNKVTKS